MVKFYELKSVPTKDDKGTVNGILLPIWKDYDEIAKMQPRYVYYTTVNPKSKKGPYLHTKRRGLLLMLEGKIKFVYKEDKYIERELSDSEPLLIDLPAGTAYLIINNSEKPAKLLNICDYPWIAGDNETIKADFSDYNE